MTTDTATITSSRTDFAKMFDVGKPELHVLSYALRHRDVWPEGFVWDFGDCDKCAMGLVDELWVLFDGSITTIFEMRGADAIRLFCSDGYPGIPAKDVTPEMVADKIDAYLANAETEDTRC